MSRSFIKFISIIAAISGLLMIIASFALIYIIEPTHYPDLSVLAQAGVGIMGFGVFFLLTNGKNVTHPFSNTIAYIETENEELNELNQITIIEESDERGQIIREKAGWVTLLVLAGLLAVCASLSVSIYIAGLFRPWSQYISYGLIGLGLFAAIIYHIARFYWRRRM